MIHNLSTRNEHNTVLRLIYFNSVRTRGEYRFRENSITIIMYRYLHETIEVKRLS